MSEPASAEPLGRRKRQPTPGAPKPITESRMNRIARRAHEIYEARGGEHGKALEDWLQAEREIDLELSAERDSDGDDH